MKRLLAALALATALSSCTPQAQTPPPPASIDLTLAKSLADSQAAIEQAKGLADINPGLKEPLNRIIATYNAVETAYLAYHNSVVSGGKPDPAQLQMQAAQLAQNITAILALYGKTQ